MALPVNQPILYYAFGGGMGHITRAAAIMRRLRALTESPLLVLTNARCPRVLETESIPFMHLPTGDLAELREAIPSILSMSAARALIVDVFPAGIAGELTELLPHLSCPKILMTRHLRPERWVEMRDAAAGYHAMLCAEDRPADCPIPAIDCCPVLIRDAQELLSRSDARRCLDITDEAPLVLGVSTGDPEWEESFFALLAKIWRRLRLQAHLRCISPRADSSRPLFELFNGVDLVVGASGYNLFHEACAAGVPGIFLPQHRHFDDQAWRARGACVVTEPESLEAALATNLAHLTPRTADASFANGAHCAVDAIMRLLDSPSAAPLPRTDSH